MHIISVAIVVLIIIVIVSILYTPRRRLARICHRILGDTRSSHDTYRIVEDLVAIVDDVCQGRSHYFPAQLNDLYDEATKVSNFWQLKPMIDDAFKAAANAMARACPN